MGDKGLPLGGVDRGEVGMSVDIGIDLGTASVLDVEMSKGKVIVLKKEPSVAAFDRERRNVIKAIGEEAELMLRRTPGNIVAVRPLRQGGDLGLHGYGKR